MKAQASAWNIIGAVHGAATTTASTPVKKSPDGPLRLASDWPMPTQRPVSVHTPERFSPNRNITRPNRATTAGRCIWKPQPSASPALRSASTIAPSATKLTSTPAVYQRACARVLSRLSLLSIRPSTLIDSTGSTHGIRLRISPPSNAARNARNRLAFRPKMRTSGPAGGAAAIGVAVGPLSPLALSTAGSARVALSGGASVMDGAGGVSVNAAGVSAVAGMGPDAECASAVTLPFGRAIRTVRVIGG